MAAKMRKGRVRISNWNARKLTSEQIDYASKDVYVSTSGLERGGANRLTLLLSLGFLLYLSPYQEQRFDKKCKDEHCPHAPGRNFPSFTLDCSGIDPC